VSRDFTAIAKRYARQVITGKIPACRQIIQACERFERDLKSKDWKYDKAKAHRACVIIELLPHSKGELARKRQLMVLEPWQVFVVINLFGFVDTDGLRKYREAFLLMTRKTGKSQLAACIAIVMGFCDGEVGAEVWIGANSMDQAKAVFVPCQKMAATPAFVEAFGIEVRASSIMQEASGNFIQPMIGKPKDGSNPHCAILDEAHEADSSMAYDAMKTGMGARAQPLLVTITTAGVNLAGPCYAQQRYAEAVLAQDVDNPRLFAMIFTIDPEDDWRDFDCWKKANPNLGVSIFEEGLKATYLEALHRPEKASIAQTKHLNRWVSSRSAWINMNDWANAADPDLDIESLKSCTATLGLDLATKSDIAAVVARVIMEDGRVALFPFLFLPESALERSANAETYRQWRAQGHLIITDGNATDFGEIEDKVRWLCDHLNVEHVGFDQWQAESTAQRLQEDGISVIKCIANVRTFSPAMVDFEANLRVGLYVHPDNPAFNWMAANIVSKPDARGNLYPRKPDGQDQLKIDAIIAALMAEAVSMSLIEPAEEPFVAFW
jgi:phage terminase large subunit-like protein